MGTWQSALSTSLPESGSLQQLVRLILWGSVALGPDGCLLPSLTCHCSLAWLLIPAMAKGIGHQETEGSRFGSC